MSAKVLVVDDEPNIRQVLRAILERAGYQIEEAANGVEALHWIRRKSFDVITMDMSMGKIDGVDTIAILQNEINTPIVVISAHLSPDIRYELAERGINHLLPKPFGQNSVLATIRQVLTRA